MAVGFDTVSVLVGVKGSGVAVTVGVYVRVMPGVAVFVSVGVKLWLADGETVAEGVPVPVNVSLGTNGVSVRVG